MHAEPVMTEQGDDTQSDTHAEVAEREVVKSLYGNIMDVLMPANPPQPKNARIVRQFDLEASKSDAQPANEAAPAPARRAQHERRTREEARAFRNRSLRAAAGLD